MPSSSSTTVTKPPKGEKAAVQQDGPKDFFWTYTEEPHRTRRLAIIKAHPEVRICPSLSSPEFPIEYLTIAARSPSFVVLSR